MYPFSPSAPLRPWHQLYSDCFDGWSTQQFTGNYILRDFNHPPKRLGNRWTTLSFRADFYHFLFLFFKQKDILLAVKKKTAGVEVKKKDDNMDLRLK